MSFFLFVCKDLVNTRWIIKNIQKHFLFPYFCYNITLDFYTVLCWRKKVIFVKTQGVFPMWELDRFSFLFYIFYSFKNNVSLQHNTYHNTYMLNDYKKKSVDCPSPPQTSHVINGRPFSKRLQAQRLWSLVEIIFCIQYKYVIAKLLMLFRHRKVFCYCDGFC